MSLFTVLKYGNTNISSSDELMKLPLGVIESYYNKALPMLNELERGHYVENLHEEMKKCFIAALREYDETTSE